MSVLWWLFTASKFSLRLFPRAVGSLCVAAGSNGEQAIVFFLATWNQIVRRQRRSGAGQRTGGQAEAAAIRRAPALTGLRRQISGPELSLDDFIVVCPAGWTRWKGREIGLQWGDVREKEDLQTTRPSATSTAHPVKRVLPAHLLPGKKWRSGGHMGARARQDRDNCKPWVSSGKWLWLN